MSDLGVNDVSTFNPITIEDESNSTNTSESGESTVPTTAISAMEIASDDVVVPMNGTGKDGVGVGDDIQVIDARNNNNRCVESTTTTTTTSGASVPNGSIRSNAVARKSTGGIRKFPNKPASVQGNSERIITAGAAAVERRQSFQTNSNSETKRSERIQAKQRKRYRYTTDGQVPLLATDFENCDCLLPDCVGCHLPCRRCGDRRCGTDCRRGRRWIYQKITLEGTDIELANPNWKSNSKK